jgi:ABC-type transporter Mla subunit MlaD
VDGQPNQSPNQSPSQSPSESPSQLEAVVLQIGDAVLATTEVVDRLAAQVEALAAQVQQQGYQIFALSDAVQTLAENHDGAMERLGQVTDALQRLVVAIEEPGSTG